MTPWDRGRWRNPPPAIEPDGDDSLVTPACGSDLRQRTSGGLRRDSGHALLEPVERHRAVEVVLAATARGTFEQAGLLLRLDERTWVKAGSSTATAACSCRRSSRPARSDWSTAPVPAWADRLVTVRAAWRRMP